MSKSSQKFIARNRAPRVQIEYDVELYGAEKKVQLPFVMGVMADLSGKPADPLAPVADRKFLEEAAASGLYELQAAQLASTKATDPAVRDLASRLAEMRVQIHEARERDEAVGVDQLPGRLGRVHRGGHLGLVAQRRGQDHRLFGPDSIGIGGDRAQRRLDRDVERRVRRVAAA
mgnify:CR=1 FL=1